LKNIDTVAPAQAEVYNVALIMKYSLSVALALKRLDTPVLDDILISLLLYNWTCSLNLSRYNLDHFYIT